MRSVEEDTMKIAIPVFQTKISPRFDQAQGFVILEMENDNIIARKTLTTQGWSVLDKMKHLVDLEVNTLICGGIDRASLQYLGFKGIKIYSWVTGEVEDAVSCFLSHRMRPGIILGKHGSMIGRWQFCNGRNHLCNMFQTNFNKAKEGVKTMPRGDGTGPRGQGPRSGKDRGGCKTGKGGRQGGGGRGKGIGSGQANSGGGKRSRGDGVKGRQKMEGSA